MNPILEFDDAALDQFDSRPFRIRHHLMGNPLFTLERLLELSRRLPEDGSEFYAGNVPIAAAPDQVQPTGLSLQETIRDIERCGSWVVLKNVEQDPEYAELLNRCLDEVTAACGASVGPIHDPVAFIFISSAASVTPCHLDPEHNFLLQVRGSKTIHIDDRSLLCPEVMERYFTGGHRNVSPPAGYETRAGRFSLMPGDGVHVPFTSPHWVVNGGDLSVSFSVTFQTASSRSRAILHKVNGHLRKAGIKPAAPGRSRILDAAKVRGFDALRRARRLFKPGAPRRARSAYS